MGHYLAVKSVVHSFGAKKVLDEVRFECNTGDIIGLFGRNGAGKSTLFNILFGTLKPNAMEIYIDGKLFEPSKEQGKLIGYHTQGVMLPRLSKVSDIISMYLPLHKQDEVCFAPGVNEMHYKRIHELSLGQQRYLQFLLILGLDHPFMILDEPFSMVEPLYKNLIKEKLLAKRADKGILISDHYYRDILDIADKSLLLKDGTLITIQNNQELIDLGYLSVQAVL
ncbi:MAG: ATP-binding cassette domain-containing protein [Bacteroidota bacterium]